MKMKKKKIKYQLILYCMLIALISVKSQNANAATLKITFKKNLTQCFVSSENCIVPIRASKDVDINGLSFETENEKIFQIRSITKLENTSAVNEILTHDKSTEDNIFEIHLKSGIIGKAYFKIKFKEIQVRHQIIVQTRIRLIDK